MPLITRFYKMKRNFISILDWTSEEIRNNIDLAVELKQKTKEGMCPKLLEGKNYGIFFHKPSLRTRLSFEVGISQLGGSSMVLSELDFKIGDLDSDIKSLKKASRQNVGPEIVERINQIIKTKNIELKKDLKIYWNNFPIAYLTKGNDYLKPEINVIVDDVVGVCGRGICIEKLLFLKSMFLCQFVFHSAKGKS